MTDAANAAMFEMTFRPRPELITAVRRFISQVYERLKMSSVVADQVIMTTHELLENATKYSTDGEATLKMEVHGSADHPSIKIRTINRVRDEDRERVATYLAELDRQDDPQSFYLELMRRSLRSSSRGGLGLGRIVAEGDMRLSMSNTGDMLELTAVHRGGMH